MEVPCVIPWDRSDLLSSTEGLRAISIRAGPGTERDVAVVFSGDWVAYHTDAVQWFLWSAHGGTVACIQGTIAIRASPFADSFEFIPACAVYAGLILNGELLSCRGVPGCLS